MSRGFSRLNVLSVSLALALTLGIADRANAQGSAKPHRRIELTETNSAEIVTNLNRLTIKKEGFNQLEDQLQQLNRKFTPNSFEGSLGAPYVPQTVVPTKTIKELLDRQKNWGMSDDEIATALGFSDHNPGSKFDEDKSDTKHSSLQQFYDTLNHSGSRNGLSRTDPSGSSDRLSNPDFKQKDDFSDDSKLPPGIKEKAQKLKEIVNEDQNGIFSPAKPKASFENFFGLGEANPVAEATRGPKTSMESFMDQFKKLLDGPSVGTRMDPALSSMLPGTSGRPNTYSGPAPMVSPAHKDEPDQNVQRTLNSLATVTAMPDVNSGLLNRWNPLYTPPKLEQPKPAPPIPPDFQFPRRRF